MYISSLLSKPILGAMLLIPVNLFFAISAADGQSASSSAGWPTEGLAESAKAAARTLWKNILTQCGDSYFYVGSGLEQHPQETERPLPGTPLWAQGQPRPYSNGAWGGDITEYSGARMIVVPPVRKSAAMEANDHDEGVEDGGYAVMESKMFRSGHRSNGSWDPWVDGPASKIPPESLRDPRGGAQAEASWFAQLQSAFGITGGSGSIIVHMRRKHGAWLYSVEGALGATDVPEYKLRSGDSYICVTKPSPTSAENPTSISGQGGTVAEIEGKLPEILRTAAIKYGLGPDGYSREAEYIKRFLDTCALSDVPPKTQMPSVNDPKYEVCQRQSKKTAFIGNSKDISLAVNNPHNTVFPKAGGRGDVLMLNGQQADTPWRPGEPNTLTISIFLPPSGAGFRFLLNSSNFDEVISQAVIKGTSSPDFLAASSASNDRPGGPSASNTAVVAAGDTTTDPVTLSDSFGAAMRGYLAKCHAGDAKSCELVGTGLEHGLGVDKNLQSAKAFYNKACSLGRKQSCSRLQ